ncbi:MAG: hypothetical protein LBU06_12460, partial [Desulfovibrio sp.]|nr:hypothetical protein [Desulfovibrio sp.]
MTKCSKGPAYGKRESARRSSGKKRGRKKSRGGGAFPLILAFIAGLLAAGGGVLLLRGTSFPELRSLLSAEISVSSPRPAAPAGRIAADAPSPAPGKGRPGKSPASAHKKDTGRTRFPVVPVPPAPSGANSPENHAGKPAEAKISASPSGSERPSGPERSSGSEGPEAAPRKVLEEGRIKAPPASPAADPPDAAPETPEAVALALAQL